METLQGEILTVIFEFSLDSSNCWLSIILTCKRWELVAFQCILKNSFRKLIENNNLSDWKSLQIARKIKSIYKLAPNQKFRTFIFDNFLFLFPKLEIPNATSSLIHFFIKRYIINKDKEVSNFLDEFKAKLFDTFHNSNTSSKVKCSIVEQLPLLYGFSNQTMIEHFRIESVKTSEMASVKSVIAQTLGKAALTPIVKEILYLLLHDSSSYVRRDAFFSLLNLKNTHNIPLSLLEMDVDPAVIISLLKELPNQKKHIIKLFHCEALLISSFPDDSLILHTLMTYGDPKIMIPAFQSVILCSKYQSERKKCLECLINLVTYEPNSVLFISSLMHDPDEKIKAIASDAILNWATGAISDIGSILGIQNYDNETIQGILEKFT